MTTTFLKPKNNALAHLLSDIAAADLTCTLYPGEGANFPTTYPFHVTIDDEIIEVSDNTTDVLTFTRAKESTSAAIHLAGSVISLEHTAEAMTEIHTAINALESYAPTTVLTTRGDIIYRNATVPARLAKGADNTILGMGANEPEWKTPAAVLGDMSGEAATAFDFNSQNLTSVGTLNTHTIPAGTDTFALLAAEQTLAAKTLTTPVIASLYQDAGKTKLMTLPDTASDTLVALAATQVLTNKTLTSPVINGTITTTGLTLPAVTLGGNMTVTDYAFDAGSGSAEINTTGVSHGLIITSTNDSTTGSVIRLKHVTTSQAVNDILGSTDFYGMSTNVTPAEQKYGAFLCAVLDNTDSAEIGGFDWWLVNAGAMNRAMRLGGAGEVWADLGFNADEYYKVAGTQVLGARGAAVADAAGGATVDAECRTAVNTLLARCRAHGFIAT
jgi:hypothetical protein